MSSKKLERSDKNRILAGVLGGLGEYLNFDANIFRIVAVILFLLSPIVMVILYLIAVFLIPKRGEPRPLASSFNASHHTSLIAGFIIFLIGAILLGPSTTATAITFIHPYGFLVIFQTVAATILMLIGLLLMVPHLKKL